MDFTGLLAAFLLLINAGQFDAAKQFAQDNEFVQENVQASVEQDPATGLYVANNNQPGSEGQATGSDSNAAGGN